jgi:hypothetical protein
MTPEEQQIALCEWFKPGCTRRLTIFGEDKQTEYLGDLPNTNSLDVLAEMERKLTDDQARQYQEKLIKIVVTLGKLFNAGKAYPIDGYVIHASAPQRREALLKTLGLWKP